MLRIVPAQQRLGADDRAIGDTHDGLVMQPQRVFLDRGAQRAFQRVLLEAVLGKIRVEELVGVAAEFLRPVHRDVGVLEQALGIVAVVRVHGNADRRGDVDVVLLDLERLRDGFLQFLRDPIEHASVLELFDDHHEFVAAQARQRGRSRAAPRTTRWSRV